MAELRCGREQRPEELERLGKPMGRISDGEPSGAALFDAPGPWSSLNGVDVCPQCQTAEERRELASRVVAMVEAEIGRVHDENANPEPHEAALIAYAMFLRERLERPCSPR